MTAGAGLTVSLIVWSRAQSKLQLGAERLERQKIELVSLQREHNRLSRLIADSTNCPRLHNSEIVQLHAELESLRQKTNRLTKASALPHPPPPIPAPTRSSSREHYGVENVVSDSASDEYKQELYEIGASSPHFGDFNIDARKDAQNLTEALRTFARAHDGEIPTTFEDAAEHFFKEYRPPLANDYEIVFQGSINDLTNIPPQAVAIIRERQPWPTPSGKLGRLYGMASGFVRIVESDDDFRAWEAEHVIPPH